MTPAATTAGVCPSCPSCPTSSAWAAERGREAAGSGAGSCAARRGAAAEAPVGVPAPAPARGSGSAVRARFTAGARARRGRRCGGRFGSAVAAPEPGRAAVRAEARAVLQPLAALVAERHPGGEPSRTVAVPASCAGHRSKRRSATLRRKVPQAAARQELRWRAGGDALVAQLAAARCPRGRSPCPRSRGPRGAPAAPRTAARTGTPRSPRGRARPRRGGAWRSTLEPSGVGESFTCSERGGRADDGVELVDHAGQALRASRMS